MNRLQNRLGQVEGKLLPKPGEHVFMRVPVSQEHWPRITAWQNQYNSRDTMLWIDSGKGLPNWLLWQPIGIG